MTVEQAIVTVVLAAVVVWLSLLTVGLLRWRRERGEPVYQRLPGGRLRFEWSVASAYGTVRRQADTDARPGKERRP